MSCPISPPFPHRKPPSPPGAALSCCAKSSKLNSPTPFFIGAITSDGRNRLDALALIGQLAVDEQGRLCIRKTDGTLEPIDQQHIVGGDPEKHAYSLNLHRRHLTPEQSEN